MKTEFIRFLNRLHVYGDYYYCMKHYSAFSDNRALTLFFKYVQPYQFLDYLCGLTNYDKTEKINQKWDEIRLLWLIYLLDNQKYHAKDSQIWHAVRVVFTHHNLDISLETLKKFFPYLNNIEDMYLQSRIKVEYELKLKQETSNNSNE